MPGTVLILGASGAFGRRATTAFAGADWTVRTFDRTSGDMMRDAKDADVIVNALNPPLYHDWPRFVPEITTRVLDAAKGSGATVLLPGNVYVYGDQPGPWSETTPHRPVARKGRIRADMEAAYHKATKDGVRTILLRGGDFLDAGNPATVLNTVVLKRLAKDRITAMGPTSIRRAYANLADMTRAAVALANSRNHLSPFEEVNFPGLTFSYDDLREEIQRQTGRELRISKFPWGLMRMASPVWELARELGEMRYLYETPHELSEHKFRSLLPDFEVSSLESVVAAHIEANGL